MDETQYGERLGKLLVVVTNTEDIRAKTDLYKIYRNCMNIFIELDKESVECRRIKHKTAKYDSLEKKLIESINEFEMWITYAALRFT